MQLPASPAEPEPFADTARVPHQIPPAPRRGRSSCTLLRPGFWGNLGVHVNIHQHLTSGTVGQSVLLPVSYSFHGDFQLPMSISWGFSDSVDRLITCAVENCSLGAGGAPSSCSADVFRHDKYHDRAEFFPENGSLLLRDLQLSDSGVYTVTFDPPHITRHINLTVHEQCIPPHTAGGNLCVHVNIHQHLTSGTVGQSVLLPVSYSFHGDFQLPMSISWGFSDSVDRLITCTVENCSLGAGGAPSSCSAKFFLHHKYHDRAEFFPENGSLLLQDLQLNDSGVYTVTFDPPHITQHINLTVHKRPDHAGECPTVPAYVYYCVIGFCSSIFLLLLFLIFWYIQHRAQKKRRIIKEQQVSSREESYVESAVMRNVITVYDTIGGSFEHPQPRPTSEVMYTTITSSPQRLDAGTSSFDSGSRLKRDFCRK
ncbi:uncharacterized protein LOC142063049 isoform X3 [Phalacrocorax aristotelis]|uniref:uncharacterized protein LOC142063049 isoform X3 n=1 Tax=Phalacrocorax aristotelis TaxID=126867 RepID=UPI003F4C2C50